MRIIADYKPVNLSGTIEIIKNSSGAALLCSVFFAGTAAGCALYIHCVPVRDFFDDILINAVYSRFSLAEMICISCTAVLTYCSVLFGAGLSLIGYPAAYVLPLFLGTLSGAFFLATQNSMLPFPLIRCILLTPLFSLGGCFILTMSEYSIEMTGMLRGKRKRVTDDWKKYVLRFMILTALTMLVFLILSFVLILFRHLN